MSGHSHFKTIKNQKELADAKRGKIFSKIAKVITFAVKEGGRDPTTNAKLKAAIVEAKQCNMPKENIERAIKRGTGELVGENLEEVSFEALGSGGVAIIIEGITDNKNRTLGEIKGILGQYGGKIAGEGAVKWMFERKGFISINGQGKLKEDLELLAIEAGAQDFKWRDNILEVYTRPEELENIKKILEKKFFSSGHSAELSQSPRDEKLKIKSVSLEWVAKEKITVDDKDKEKAQKLFEALDENDAVQDIYSNLRF